MEEDKWEDVEDGELDEWEVEKKDYVNSMGRKMRLRDLTAFLRHNASIQ